MKADGAPQLPPRVPRDELSCSIYIPPIAYDDVSVLSCAVSSFSPSGTFRFDHSPRGSHDSSPRKPLRGFSARKLSASDLDQQEDSIAAKINDLLSMVSRMEVNMSAHDATPPQEVDVHDEVRKLRELFEEERKLRLVIEAEKLAIEKDMALTAKADLALKEVMTAMRQHLASMQARREAAKRDVLFPVLLANLQGEQRKNRKTHLHPPASAKCTKERGAQRTGSSSTCFTIPESDMASSEYDSSGGRS